MHSICTRRGNNDVNSTRIKNLKEPEKCQILVPSRSVPLTESHCNMSPVLLEKKGKIIANTLQAAKPIFQVGSYTREQMDWLSQFRCGSLIYLLKVRSVRKPFCGSFEEKTVSSINLSKLIWMYLPLNHVNCFTSKTWMGFVTWLIK